VSPKSILLDNVKQDLLIILSFFFLHHQLCAGTGSPTSAAHGLAIHIEQGGAAEEDDRGLFGLARSSSTTMACSLASVSTSAIHSPAVSIE
jgi:hypothetical protein